MQTEIPQSISGTPTRWGAFTAPQLGWIAIGAALPYLLLRCHLTAPLLLILSTPWLAAALVFAFGRYEGRRLDAWTTDWLVFLVQPHHLHHPDPAALGRPYFEVDSEALGSQTRPTYEVCSLPWVAP
ncbi:MAG: hypothetical protein WAO09_01190 [Candidatus Dormiibacterota bacterium]|jgi:hypothetical protein